MRTKFKGILTLLLAFVVHISFAQDKTITGTVSDQDGLPLPGVNIVVEGTTNGTQTDFDGNYSISGSEGQSLLFSYIGQRDVREAIGAGNTINVQMQEDAQALEEVVVTAQGIKREKKALGYAVTSVGSEALEDRAEGDVARVLSGKAAGVQITSASGTAGSATNVVIRGLNSFSGNNQALFIVDGVPFSNDTNNDGASGNASFIGGNTGGSRFLDLDPNNIANIEVLKGLSAATLYGTQGRNGVILITTKSGSSTAGPKKTEVTISSSYFANEIASTPDYQDSYGNGFDQAFGWFFSNWGPSFDEGGTAGWGAQAAIDENGTLAHPYSTASAATGIPQAFPEFDGARYPWQAYDSFQELFRPGYTTNTNANISGSSDDGKTAFNANIGHYNDVGFTPGNRFDRLNISLGGVAELSNKLTIRGTMNYAKSNVFTPPVAASRGNGTDGLSVFGNVFFTPRSVDLMGLPFENPITGGSVYYRQNNSIINPRWTAKNVVYNQNTNRFFWNLSAQFKVNDNIDFNWRTGLDFYNERNTNSSNKGGVAFNSAIFGFLDTYDNNNTIWDHFVSINGNYDLSEKLGLSFTAGATSRQDTFDRNGVSSTGQIVFGVKRHFNFENQLPIQFSRKRNIMGVLGSAILDYDDFLFLNLSARKDWVSNFQSANNNIIYPGASLSFLPTNAFNGIKSENGLNFLKLRASYGTSANFDTNSAYPTVGFTEQNTQVFNDPIGGGSVTTNQVANFKANPDLKPELLTEVEFGIESKLWKNRVSLDFTYFKKTTEDLIVQEPLAPSTGFTLTQSNIGEIQNDGFEAVLGIDLIRSENFTWNSSVNFFTNEVIVTEQEQDQIFYAGSLAAGGGLFRGSNVAQKGKSLQSIVGTRIDRDDNGNFIVNSAGSYQVSSQDEDGLAPIIGDATPDYVMNFINTLSYKNLSLGFQINHTKGGDILSSTVATLLGRGLIVETEDRLGTYILPGVKEDGSVNNTQINNSTYFFSNLLFGPTETRIYDASVVRLQEVSLSYRLPAKALERTPFGQLSFTLQGFNLWYNAYNTPAGANFDPNVQGVGVGNGSGFDFINGPSARRYGFTIKASF